jgi:exopolysaccharide biosynthesis polyprenyl glycosylphosphotransferase
MRYVVRKTLGKGKSIIDHDDAASATATQRRFLREEPERWSARIAPAQRVLRLMPARRARHRLAVLRQLLVAADLGGGALGGLAGALMAGLRGPELLAVALALTLTWPLLTWSSGLLASADLSAWASGIGDSGRLLLAALAVSWVALALLSWLGTAHPAAAALTTAACTGLAASILRASARVVAHRRRTLCQRTVIVGSGLVADRLATRVRSHDELGLELIGTIDDKPLGEALQGLPRLGGLEDLERVLAEHRVDRVMFAFSRAGHEQLLHALRTCRDARIAVDVVPRLFEFLDGARTLDQIGGLPLLSIEAPSLSRPSRGGKRALDVVGAALGLLLLAPLLLVAAIAIKLDTRGPVLFRQVRVGRGGRHFTLYKFRSMRVGSSVLVRPDGAIVKDDEDPRVTRIGRVLRRLSLDELPQLFNVLRGEMSLVGPRPLVLAEAQALTEAWQNRRADLRPGLTGPWQVAGRSNIPFQEMIRFDYQYVSGWSLGRDLAILLATLPAVFSGRGAC